MTCYANTRQEAHDADRAVGSVPLELREHVISKNVTKWDWDQFAGTTPTPTWRSSSLSHPSAPRLRPGRRHLRPLRHDAALRHPTPAVGGRRDPRGHGGHLRGLLPHARRGSRRALRGPAADTRAAGHGDAQPRSRQAVVHPVLQVRAPHRHGRPVRLAGARLLVRLERADQGQDHREGAAHVLADRRRRRGLAA